jgi:UDP-N-acetylglucosamine 2-epimerase
MSRLLAAERKGMRPEASKLASVVYALKTRNQEFYGEVVATAQHCQMFDQVFQ